MTERLSASASVFVESIKINRTWREKRGDRAFWLKRRKPLASWLLAGANTFFRVAGSPMRTFTESKQWQRWEVDSFVGLHGPEGFRAFTNGKRTIGAEELPGINVTIPLDNGSLTPEIAAAVGRELCRAHNWYSPVMDGPWSHGDPHAGNFIYDAATDRARIIDFEVIHQSHLTPDERHADDVLIFLQDIVGRIREEQWLPCAQAFLNAYDREEITSLVFPQLQLPHYGAARLWWKVRTSFLPTGELNTRLEALRAARRKPAVRQL